MIERAKEICTKYAAFNEENIPFDALIFGNRTPIIAEARRVVFYVLYFENYGTKSQREISALLNLKRCSANYAVKMVRDRLRFDVSFANFIKSL